MTNAEYLIKSGIKFGEIAIATSKDYHYWEFIYRGKEMVGWIEKRPLDSMAENAFKTWLDMEREEPPALDEAEKRYLRAVIRPWRDKVLKIWKDRNVDLEDIKISYADGTREQIISFPYFEKGTMYKGMERGREYSLEELGI